MKKFVAMILVAVSLMTLSLSSAFAYTGKVTASPYLSLRSSAEVPTDRPGKNIKAYVKKGVIVTFTSKSVTNGFLYLTKAPSHKKRDLSDTSVDRTGYGHEDYIK